MVLFTKMNKEEIGKFLMERRVSLNVSQAHAAELCGVSVHTLSNLETARGNVTLETLLKVTDTLGLKVTVGV